jgi:fructose-bisphosphate aldolase, class II
MIAPTSDFYRLAYAKYASRAYNVNSLEQTLGLFIGCADFQTQLLHVREALSKK